MERGRKKIREEEEDGSLYGRDLLIAGESAADGSALLFTLVSLGNFTVTY